MIGFLEFDSHLAADGLCGAPDRFLVDQSPASENQRSHRRAVAVAARIRSFDPQAAYDLLEAGKDNLSVEKTAKPSPQSGCAEIPCRANEGKADRIAEESRQILEENRPRFQEAVPSAKTATGKRITIY